MADREKNILKSFTTPSFEGKLSELTMNKSFIYDFIKKHKLAVLSTCTQRSRPEAALIGIAVSENLEIIFDTVTDSRKYQNIIINPFVALVIGWNDERTIQYEGKASLLSGEDAGKYKEIYYAFYPDGRQRATTWQGLVHFKIDPQWIRYSDFNDPQLIEEMSF